MMVQVTGGGAPGRWWGEVRLPVRRQSPKTRRPNREPHVAVLLFGDPAVHSHADPELGAPSRLIATQDRSVRWLEETHGHPRGW